MYMLLSRWCEVTPVRFETKEVSVCVQILQAEYYAMHQSLVIWQLPYILLRHGVYLPYL